MKSPTGWSAPVTTPKLWRKALRQNTIGTSNSKRSRPLFAANCLFGLCRSLARDPQRRRILRQTETADDPRRRLRGLQSQRSAALEGHPGNPAAFALASARGRRSLRQHAVVRIVFLGRKRERRPQDYRDALRAQQIFDFVSLGAAGEDHPQSLFVAKFDGVADLARAIGKDQKRQFAANNGRERFEFDVPIVFCRRAFLHNLGVVTGALQPVGDFIHLLVVFLLGVGVGLFFSRKGGEIEGL